MSEFTATLNTNLFAADAEEKRALAEQIAIREKEVELREGLPFLHGWPWYPWALDFFNSTNKLNFLCAANQVSKSSTQIRKCIDWATNVEKWPMLWRRKPKQFWYMYPSQKVADAEWLTKWSLFMPQGKYKNHPVYGWKEQTEKGHIVAIHFNTGVHVFFKTYSQSADDLQSGTLDALFCDEEMPEHLWDELVMRLNASEGYFHMVFTATLGQEFWRQVMEPRLDEIERFPTAAKQSVSLYDSQKYVDGSLSQWTDEKIAVTKMRCKSHAEFLKRVMGRFVVSGGRKYEAFDAVKHVKDKHPVPSDWLVYEGIDWGGGGEDPRSHKSAICFVAVRPDFRQGRVIVGWRGDGVLTTCGDVFNKHLELKKLHKLKPVLQCYDFSAKDLSTIAERNGETFIKADKAHDRGEEIINTLFQFNMLAIYEDPELSKLVGELSTLLAATAKRAAKDDFADAFRYAVTRIPWDFTALTSKPDARDNDTPEKPLNAKEQEIADRRRAFETPEERDWDFQSEFDDANDAYGN